jgi:hypothetical protein
MTWLLWSKMKLPILAWLIAVLVPLALIGLGIRVLLTPAFLRIEYNMPYFPADQYGFTKEDRLQWAPYALDYLINSADISYLGDLKFDNEDPLYNERELSHMEDVKVVTLGALNAWYWMIFCNSVCNILQQYGLSGLGLGYNHSTLTLPNRRE